MNAGQGGTYSHGIALIHAVPQAYRKDFLELITLSTRAGKRNLLCIARRGTYTKGCVCNVAK